MWCGNYGEVGFSETFLDCLQYVVENTQAKCIITTNASVRSETWWKEVAKLLKGRGKVNFSIDGLEDTNKIYRVNSNWNKIVSNVKAFNSVGGRSRWDYLVFDHNEHQVDDAVELAKTLGFEQFQIKLTNRFVNDTQYTQGGEAQAQEVKNKRSEYVLGMPKNPNFQGSGKTQNQEIIEKYGSWKNYVNTTPIKCKWQPNGQLFIDFEARVWSCTWTASGYHHYGDNTQKHQAQQLFDKYGKNFNSLRHHSIGEILNNDYFANDFCASWQGTMEDEVPKLLACGRTCGTDYEFSSAYGSNRRIVEL
jgi:sulfatase maturation enzyme AslB (radical SAM superfamily)